MKQIITLSFRLGKTSLIERFVNNHFLETFYPSCNLEGYSKNLIIGNTSMNIGIWDTNGQEDYDTLRPLSYPQTVKIFILWSFLRIPK